MDLTELSNRCGIDRRKLRYVLDHELVPGLHVVIHDQEWGRPRYFGEEGGFGIVCAAHLLEAGLRHDTIRGLLRALITIRFKIDDSPTALTYALQRNELPSYAIYGDEVGIRVRIGDRDTEWRATRETSQLLKKFDPVVSITLNIGRIRDQVFNGE